MASQKNGRLPSGKTFVFTGRLENYIRAEAEDLVEQLGGRTTASVSGTTDYLATGDNPGHKIEEARKQNVNIIKERTLVEMVDREG